MKGEVWEKLPGYENRYFISNMGRLARKKKYAANTIMVHEGRTQTQKKLIALYAGIDGYAVSLQLRKDKRVTRSVRRLVGMVFLYAQPEDRITHRDGDIYNNRVDNLRLSCFDPRTKLNPRQVDYCVEKRAEGVPVLDLAQRFMITPDTIHQHLTRRRREENEEA